MQKWWLIGAGLVGVGLAVLLLGRGLDTGDAVADPEAPAVPAPVERGEPIDEGLVRQPLQERTVRRGLVRPGSRPPTLTTADGATIGEEIRTPNPNPLARRAAARRDTPEARYAARTLAPWTQVRREIASAGSGDPEAEALVGAVNDLLEELRVLRRDPITVDYEDLAAQQAELMARIRSSPFAGPGVEEMLGIIEQRQADYAAEVASDE